MPKSRSFRKNKTKKMYAGSVFHTPNAPAQLTPYYSNTYSSSPVQMPLQMPVPLPVPLQMPVPLPVQMPVLTPIYAPSSKKDPRFLGKGSSKMIWLMYPDAEMEQKRMPRMDRVMVNAFTEQLLHKEHGSHEHIIAKKMREQRNEFLFTIMVRQDFPDLIPEVYELVHADTYFPQPRFRYAKDRCDPLPRDADLFHRMIDLSDRIIDQGWVYLDMKPGNVGLFQGRVLLIDTDPTSFYRIPPMANEDRRRNCQKFYRESCHMIIVLFCLNQEGEIPTEVLQEFVVRRGYTLQSFRETYAETPIDETSIASYNNEIAASRGFTVHVEPRDIMHPKDFIRHYGTFEGLPPLIRLQQLLEYTPDSP